MSIESDLVAALSPLVGGRVFPLSAPNTTTSPFITYQQVGGRSVAFLESAVVGKRNARFQINCWSTDFQEVADLMRSVSDALVTSSTLRAMPLGEPVSEFADLVYLYGASQDFSVWF